MYMARFMFKIVLIVELFRHKRGKLPSLFFKDYSYNTVHWHNQISIGKNIREVNNHDGTE